MAITWTTAELEAIQKQTLGDLRPSYYSITSKSYIQISSDFEGYLILQSADDKQKVLTWMTDVNKINNDKTDQNELLNRFMAVRSDDVAARITELDDKLDEYSNMQADLITDGKDPSRYGDIIELSLMVNTISRPIDNLNLQREQAFHEQNMIQVITDAVRSEQVNDDTTKELTSWQTIMSTYKGQTAQSTSTVGLPTKGGLF